MNTKHRIKTILPLAAVAAAFALAPATQAEVIDSYGIAVTSTTSSLDFIAPIEILNPDGFDVQGSGTVADPYTFIPGTAGTSQGLTAALQVSPASPPTPGDRHWTNHNGSGQFQSSQGAVPATAWLKFDLGQNYNLDQLRVWNGDFFRAPNEGPMSGEPDPNPRFSAKQTDLYYSSAEADPGDDFSTNWTLIGTAGALELSIPTLFSGGVSNGDWEATDEIDLNGINARWFAMKVNNTHGQPWFRIAEVQFVEAVGPAAPFAITKIDYAPGDNMVTLTWNSREGEKYAVKFSKDMTSWGEDLDDDVDADAGDTTTKSYDLTTAGLAGAGRVYFRVERL